MDERETHGYLLARVESVERDVKEIKADVKTLIAEQHERKGLRVAIIALASAIATAASLVIQWLTGRTH